MTDWHGRVQHITERLVLRGFRADDLAPYAVLNADPVVMQYLGGPISAAESDATAGYAMQLLEREGIGLLAVERRTDGAFLGMCGVHRLSWYPEDVEIAWRLAREHWGHGYATEAARTWLDHAFTTLDVARVISVTDVPNLRSIAVMQRLGMAVDHHARLQDEDGQTFDAVIHAIGRADWARRTG